jgi:hypothetical protein
LIDDFFLPRLKNFLFLSEEFLIKLFQGKGLSAGDGIRTREGTHPLGPQPSAFDRSTTPANSNVKLT